MEPQGMMVTSEKTELLLPALAAVQGQGLMVAPNRDNLHLHNRYADLAAVWTVVRPVLAKHGLVVLQTTAPGADGPIVLTRLVHVASGQWIETALTAATGAEKGTSTVQKVGSVVSHCRRYSLCTLLGVTIQNDPDDDDGALTNPRQEPGWAAAEKMGSALITGLGACETLDALRAWWTANAEDISALPEDLHDQVTAAKNARKAALAKGPATGRIEPPAAPPAAPKSGVAGPPDDDDFGAFGGGAK